jgi:hypothetical protein
MTMPIAAGVADVQARISEIQTRLGIAPNRAAAGSSATDFNSVLAGLGVEGSDGVTSTTGGSADGQKVVNIAKKYLGTPYVWGGAEPGGFDCSGLVRHVYEQLGIDLPRVSRDQARAGTAVPGMDQAQPGDLLFFGSPVDHVGIYAGEGQMVVAPRRGDVVKVQDVYDTPVAIRRVLPARPAESTSGTGFDALFRKEGAEHGVDPRLLEAVARAESSLRPDAVSPAGAQGLMQLMPSTARGLGVNPLDPAQAVDGAARLLSDHLRRYNGNTELALAAYNAGPGAVARHGGIPPYEETQTYVRRVMDLAGRS